MKLTLLPQKRNRGADAHGASEDKPFAPFYKGTDKAGALICNNLLYILAFLIPCMTLLAIMQYFSFAPFGSQNMFVSQGAFYNMTIVTDAIHALRSGTFHWFTLSGSTGMEYYSTFAYYLCSPFTLFCLLFEQETAVSLLSVFSVLRICAAGPLFLYYLTHREFGTRGSKYNPSLLIFSLGYTLSSYALVQYNDFMFLDIFMLFPLLLLGLERLMRGRGNRLFYIILSLCLFSNFYLGLIVILFLLPYVILVSDADLTQTLKSLLRFLGFSLLSVCSCAVTVIPGMAGMYRSMISVTNLPIATNVHDYFTFFYQHLFYNFPSYRYQAQWGYNLYCGLGALMLACLYFFVRKESWMRRLRSFLLLLFLILSLQFNPLAYVMHLGNACSTYYNAYAFLYLFLLLLLAYEALQNLQQIPVPAAVIGLVAPIALCLAAVAVSAAAPNFSSVQFSVSLMILYAIVILLFRFRSIRRETLFYSLLIVSSLELLANAFQSYNYIAQSSAPVQQCIVHGQSDAAQEGGSDILALHSDILYGSRQYRALTYDLNSRYGVNPFLTSGSAQQFSPLEDAMNGVQSLYVNRETASKTDYATPNDAQYRKTGSYEEYDIYENRYALPAAYPVGQAAMDETSVSHATFFANQNSIAAALGASGSLYEDAGLACSVQHTVDSTVKNLGHNIFSFHTAPDSEEMRQPLLSYELTFTPERSGDLYLWTTALIHFGPVEAGREYTYTLSLPPSAIDDSVYWIQAAYLNTDLLDALTAQLSERGASLRYDGASRFVFDMECETDASIMTCLPYSRYYHVYVDGSRTDAVSFEDYLCIPVRAGTHTITISYAYTPFYIGLWCSILTLVLTLLSCILRRRALLPEISRIDMLLSRCVPAFSGFCRDNYVYLLAFFIPFLSIAGYMVYLGCEPFGSLICLFSGDSIHGSFPANAESISLSLKDWPAHSWNGGGGYGVLTLFSSMHLPSISWHSVPYSRIIGYTTISWLITLSLCGPSLIYYLTHRLTGTRAHKKDPRLLIASLSYCMCNYFIVMLNNYGWYIAFLLLPLLLLQMDRLMIEGRKRGYILILFLAVLDNYYITMFSCIYLVVRFFTYHFDGIKDFLRKGIRFALCSLCIIGPAFNTLYFALHSLAGSTYSEADSAASDSVSSLWFNSFAYVFNRQGIFANTQSVSWNEGDVNLYFGVLTLLLVCIYTFSKGIPWREKLRQLLPYGIFFIALNQPTVNYVINGFHYQHGVPNRFAFLLAFMAAALSYDAIVHLRRQGWKQVVAPFLLLAGIFSVSFLLSEGGERNMQSFLATLFFLTIYCITLLLIRYRKKQSRACTVLLLLIFILELNLNESSKLADNYGFSQPIYYTQEASDLLHKEFHVDDSLARITNPNPMIVNYPFASDLKGSPVFAGGVITKYQIGTADYNGLSAEPNAIQSTDSQTLMGNAMAHNRYILINNHCDTANLGDLADYKPIAYTANTLILENDNGFPFGYYLPASILQYHYSGEDQTIDNTASFWNLLSRSLLKNEDTILDTVAIRNKAFFADLQEDWMEKVVRSADKKIFHFNVTMPDSGELYARISAFQYVGNYQKGAVADFEIDISNYSDAKPTFATNVFVFHKDVFFNLLDAVNRHAFEVTYFTDETVEGTIDMPEDGIVNFSMPYDPLWQAEIDGEPARTQPLSDAYLCMRVPAGKHTIRLTYVDERWKMAAAVTVGSWLLMILAFLAKDLYVRKQIRRKKEQ